MADTFLIVLVSLLVAYVAVVFWLLKTGRLQKWDLSLMLGVVLMQRTQRGKGTIDAIARPRRLWNAVGDAGIALTLGGMVAITAFFLWGAWLALQPGSGLPALGLREILVIPGVNPFVPLWYGLVALAITLVVHEGGHGVLARANGMKLKSLGLLWLVVPIGAFVEPEELDLKVARRRVRLRVFGAGPAVNVAFAVLALVGFAALMGAVAPKAGAWIGGVGAWVDDAGTEHDLPAKAAGMAAGDVVVSACVVPVSGVCAAPQPVDSWADLSAFLADQARPRDRVDFALDDGRHVRLTLANAWETLGGSLQARIQALGADDFAACRSAATAAPRPGTCEAVATCIVFFDPDPATGRECADRLYRRSRAGVSSIQPESLAYLSDPLQQGGLGLARLAQLPVQEVLSQEPVLSVYVPAFYEAPVHAPTFWVLANLLFWVFWINLMVGVTNILPMLPLDGGHIFREAVGGALARARPRMPAERREKVVGAVALAMTLLILTAMLVQILAPHIVGRPS